MDGRGSMYAADSQLQSQSYHQQQQSQYAPAAHQPPRPPSVVLPNGSGSASSEPNLTSASLLRGTGSSSSLLLGASLSSSSSSTSSSPGSSIRRAPQFPSISEDLPADEQLNLYKEQNGQLKKLLQYLQTENEKLKIDVFKTKTEKAEMAEVLNSQLEELSKQIQETKTRAGKQRSTKDQENDITFQTKFSLPDTEFSIVYYGCCNKDLKAGTLYICPAYVCFELSSVMPINWISSNQKFSFPYYELAHVNKIKSTFMPGSGHSLEFKLLDGTIYQLRGFRNREEVIDNIKIQSSQVKLGHKIEFLSNGKPDSAVTPGGN